MDKERVVQPKQNKKQEDSFQRVVNNIKNKAKRPGVFA
jgi:hypothetical protein